MGYSVIVKHPIETLIELDYGKIYRKALYLMVKTMVSCKFSLKPIQWNTSCDGHINSTSNVHGTLDGALLVRPASFAAAGLFHGAAAKQIHGRAGRALRAPEYLGEILGMIIERD